MTTTNAPTQPATPGTPPAAGTPSAEGLLPPGLNPANSWAEAMRQIAPQAGIVNQPVRGSA